MNPQRTWTVALAAALLFAFIYFFDSGRPSGQAAVPAIIPGLHAADVSSVQVTPAGQFAIGAERTNDVWRLATPVAYPAQQAAIRNLIEALEGLRRGVFISPQDLKDQPNAEENYGFDKPQFNIVLQGPGASHRIQVQVGRNTATGDQVYVRVVGAEIVDVVNADLLKLIPRDEKTWRDTTFVKLSGLAYDRLVVTSGANVMELQLDAAKNWRLPQHSNARADNGKINELLYRLETVPVSQFVTDNPRADLDSYGLQPPQLQLAFMMGTNQALALQFGRNATNDDRMLFARIAGRDSIVLVPREDIDPWRAPYQDFRDLHLLGPPAGPLQSIEVRGADNFTVFRTTNDAWEVSGPDGFPADPDSMKLFIDELSQLQGQVSKEVVPETAMTNYGLAAPSRQYILRTAATNAAGVLTNVIVGQLDFGAEQSGGIFARRADQPDERPVVYTVKLSDFSRLPSRGIQLFKRRIWDFDPRSVSTVTVRINGKLCQLGHAGPNRWLLTGGQGSVNPSAVELAVTELGALVSMGWVERGDQDRVKYGFPALPHSGNQLQISVELVDGDQRRTLDLDFGDKTSDGSTLYAMTRMSDGRNWIFLMPPNMVTDILNGFNVRELAGK